MIKVCYSELDGPKGLSLRLEAAGHAGYAPAGQDIVCAGASTLMQALVYLLAGEESARSDAWDEPDGPRLAVAVQAPVAPWVQGAFELAKAGFTLLAERYPDNLRFADVSRSGQQSMMDLQLFAEGEAAPALSPEQTRQAVAAGTLKPEAPAAQPEAPRQTPAEPEPQPEAPAQPACRQPCVPPHKGVYWGKKEAFAMWFVYALGSAVFAALTSILAKIGIEGVNSTLATAIRTAVVLLMSWGMVFLTGTQTGIAEISRRSWLFLVLSGLATGASWLCYYHALQVGVASKVVPIDKLSVVITLALAFVVLHEPFTAKSLIGCALITAGTLFMVL